VGRDGEVVAAALPWRRSTRAATPGRVQDVLEILGHHALLAGPMPTAGPWISAMTSDHSGAHAWVHGDLFTAAGSSATSVVGQCPVEVGVSIVTSSNALVTTSR